MPHLSPMNWIMAIMLLWFLFLTLYIYYWWITQKKLILPNLSMKTKHSYWTWLQDGRVDNKL